MRSGSGCLADPASGKHATRENIGVESLRPVQVLYDGDVYDLAVLLLKLYDAKADRDGHRGRRTVHGVASAYARLMIDISTEQVEARIKEHGLPLGAVVDWEGGPA
jgi:hypothetical protein